MPDQKYSVVYNDSKNHVRIARVTILGFEVVFTVNENLKKPRCTVHVAQKTPLHPEIQFGKNGFTMSYGYVVLTQDDMQEFRATWDDAMQFCKAAKPIVDEIKANLEAGVDI